MDTAQQKGHPKGLYLLFFTEMWERFSYYGMRGILILYLTKTFLEGGLAFDEGTASLIYGWFTGFVYFTPLIGGWLADKYLGQRLSITIGGLTMMVGQLILFSIGSHTGLYLGLFLLIIGNGFFKPNISTLVGGLYKDGDERRDSAFSIFYMGINLGAFLAPLVIGFLTDKGFWGRKYCYHKRVPELLDLHAAEKDCHLLDPLKIQNLDKLSLELKYDAQIAAQFAPSLPKKMILCHLSTSTNSKEWPVERWAEFYQKYPELHSRLLFTTGPSDREQNLLRRLAETVPPSNILNSIPSLTEFMAIIANADVVICGDTSIAHFAGGLQKPVVVLFGPTNSSIWKPVGRCEIIHAPDCHCRHFFYKCSHSQHCLSKVPAEEVYKALQQFL